MKRVACRSLVSKDETNPIPRFPTFFKSILKTAVKEFTLRGSISLHTFKPKPLTKVPNLSQAEPATASEVLPRPIAPSFILHEGKQMMRNEVPRMKEQTYSMRQWQSAGLQEFIKKTQIKHPAAQESNPNDWHHFLLQRKYAFYHCHCCRPPGWSPWAGGLACGWRRCGRIAVSPTGLRSQRWRPRRSVEGPQGTSAAYTCEDRMEAVSM